MNARAISIDARGSAQTLAPLVATRPLHAVVGVVGFAVLTALSSLVAIPLPHTPVPITLQTLVVVMAGVTLGPRLGLLSMLFYLLLGTTGYHVFAENTWGLTTIVGPTGGYLVGFALAQPVIGWFARRSSQWWRNALLAALIGQGVVFACGLLWLAVWSGAGALRVLELGFYPFLPGLAVKTLIATGVGGATLPLAKRYFPR